ncbi:MAG: Aspartyl/glutamyl-tRNA(Asn/Gln) amidotransferase subunit B [Candidatus Curtissbacteria bacterium GW2011_GWA1_40_9]|uniref:Aspartyl/glutamyl-tRNA(Asn/Gln) amidotransferase subunit B n=1 Tax=Candidatus Curtissbacteria bacterium GW2011_GWA1_40_9 TaxID=1618408 RepID=A0A0G0WRY7_9BACT|nr:MAG: Aspartyl/glutamyl-tRNA(Asn/Gln) amidotransferase subunit B [Candidatus Curtissbacteria bacterium GW2011_GWA1_40_9]
MNDKRLATSEFEAVIGLEVHVELYTKSKMFCSCSADYFGKEPNTHVCPVCLGLPGALPAPNKQAIKWCVAIGLALNCQIPTFSKFDRKNYFYPDLPKGYQISQYDQPFCVNGHVILSNGKKIRITRAHMEEDTAKLTHAKVDGKNVSLIDFNRSGVPLVEIVTEPDFESAQEVVEYLKLLQQTVRYLGVSEADMEKGDMRLEPNISLKRKGGKDLPKYKVEVKNINSFKFVERAIAFEIKRQGDLLERGQVPRQETRGWNEQKQETTSQRSKEEAHDYRYFPEPDIPPIRWSQTQIGVIKKSLPELPQVKLARFRSAYGLSFYDAKILTREKPTADYFEKAVLAGKKHGVLAKQVANLIINKKPDIITVPPVELVQNLIAQTTTRGISDETSNKIAQEIIDENPTVVKDYKEGKTNAIQVLIGKVMQKNQGKAEPRKVKEILEKLLGAR